MELEFTVSSPWDTSPGAEKLTYTDEFTWTVKNHCIDPNIVDIVTNGVTALDDRSYKITAIETWAAFSGGSIEITGDDNGLCGDLSFTASSDETPVTDSTTPVGYLTALKEFQV